MKEFISLKNIKKVRLYDNEFKVWLDIHYFDKEDGIFFEFRLGDINQDSKDYIIRKCEEAYIKIKNALIEKQDFVEVEL